MFANVASWLDSLRRKRATRYPSSPRILICSGASRVRYPTAINHKIYADRHGYEYRFDIVPREGLRNLYYHKLAIILDALPHCDWLFWLDDDAAFTRIDQSLENLVPELQDSKLFAIFCKSPINRGMWTLLSAGNFLIKNCEQSLSFLHDCLGTDLDRVKEQWREAEYGMFFGGDQEAMIHQIMNSPGRRAGIALLDYTRFNTRPFHFSKIDDHFLVHFTHSPDRSKGEQMKDFADKFGLSEFLVPQTVAAPYHLYFPHMQQMIGRD